MPILNRRWVDPDAPSRPRPANHHDLGALEALCASGDFDVVIVGGGGAAAVVAIAVTDQGGRALVLEKAERAGGNTELSGGSLRTVTDAEAMTEHLVALSQGATPRAVVESFVESLAGVPDWITAHGGVLGGTGGAGAEAVSRMLFPMTRRGAAYPELPGAASLAGRTYVAPRAPGRDAGAGLWDFLEDALADSRAPVVLGARVVGLVEDDAGAVVGVEVAAGARRVPVRARLAVVLACGGFAYDEELQLQYRGLSLPTVSGPGIATGDGIRLAQSVGADLWHLSAVSTSVGYRMPELDAGFYCEIRDPGFVLVDQLGRRYVDESALENHAAVHEMTAPDFRSGRFLRTPSFVVLDEATRLAGPLTRQPNGANVRYPWSADNSIEIERGWIRRAASLQEMARIFDLPAVDLTATIEQYNASCEAGTVDGFGRGPGARRALAGPPYYGAAVYPILLNTQGGPRRDEGGRILRPGGASVPGLYGAGELGSIWGRLYPGTGNISECLASGLLAASTIFKDAG